MAKGKGKGRNYKKKTSVNRGGRAANQSSNAPSSSPYLKGEIPDFGERSQAIRDNFQTLYSRYKSATRRFMDYIHKNVPKGVIEEDEKSVNFLLSAADWMESTSHTIEPMVLRDLKLSIRIRKRVAKSVFGGGDAKHKYFLDVLVYCWTVLRLLPRKAGKKKCPESEGSNEGGHYSNQYSVLGVEIEDNEDDLDEDQDIPTEVSRPVADKMYLTIEELMNSDDRSDAILFLMTLDELMSMVATHYHTVQHNIKNNRQQGYPESAIMKELLEAAVVSNFAIQQVQQLEMELQSQHEHLSTPYRLMSVLVLPELTSDVDQTLIKHARGPRKWRKQDIIAFLGDCMECYFHNPSDKWNRKDEIVQDFCNEYKVNAEGRAHLDLLFKGLQHLVILEVPMKMELQSSEQLRRITQQHGNVTQSHSWLSDKWIGGDRSIIHTVRTLQLFAGVIGSTPMNNERHFDPRLKGQFGSSNWPLGCSGKMRDMDELLMATILPEWMKMVRRGIVGKMRFPRENELSALFMQLRHYVENPQEPVSWSLTFGVHAMLTGMMEVKQEVHVVMRVSKAIFEKFFALTAHAAKLSLKEQSSGMQNSEVWKHNICMVSILESFGMDVFKEQAIWNPLCAGTTLSIISLFGNLEIGCAVIDSQAQLRIVLYLYHGLLINNIIQKGQIVMLDILYEAFKKCKAVWCGELPSKGELVQRFWICFGMGLKESKQMAEKAREFTCGGVLPSASFVEGARFCRGRKMSPINPRELATSFKRVCERNFSGVVDKYHTPEQRNNAQGTEQYLFAVRTNDTLDHLEDELQLLSINFFTTAYYLEQFVCSIGRVLQWENFLKSCDEDGCKDLRQGFAILFAQHLLGALDFARDPLNHEFLDVPLGLASSSWMGMYFEKIPADNILWFQAIQSDYVQVQTSPFE